MTMVDKAYLLEKPPGPSSPKLFLDQWVIPLAIDVLGAGEVAVERVSQRTGVRPLVVIGAVAGTCLLFAALAFSRRTGAEDDSTIETRVRAAM